MESHPAAHSGTVYVESVDELWAEVPVGNRVQVTFGNGVIIVRKLIDGTYALDSMQLFAAVASDLQNAKEWVDSRVDAMQSAPPLVPLPPSPPVF